MTSNITFSSKVQFSTYSFNIFYSAIGEQTFNDLKEKDKNNNENQ